MSHAVERGGLDDAGGADASAALNGHRFAEDDDADSSLSDEHLDPHSGSRVASGTQLRPVAVAEHELDALRKRRIG